MNKEDKFIITDVTDNICIGGFGNDLGNISLLKYSEQEIANMIIENNNSEDNIRLVNSLLGTIRKQKEVIDKAINDIDLVIELIKQQPTEDDSWILGRLNAFKIILKEVE